MYFIISIHLLNSYSGNVNGYKNYFVAPVCIFSSLMLPQCYVIIKKKKASA